VTDNLAIWNALERTDPKHVKPITGKSYQGNSPRPHWVIWKLTERFGPVGQGFGWDVMSDGYIAGIPHADGTEKLHECRIRFWWGADARHVESYGCTKALYKAGTKGGAPGYWVSDEDAAKKSLTDAITKAASWLGVAGDIFMGRWDDSKYVAELKAEAARPPARIPIEDQRAAFAGSLEPPHDPETGEIPPPPNPAQSASDGLRDAWVDGIRDSLPEHASPVEFQRAVADALIAAFAAKKSARGCAAQWDKRDGLIMEMQLAHPPSYQRVLDAFNARMAELREPAVMGEIRVG
jgi:hypothetical protein